MSDRDDLEAIRRLKARYFRYLDAKDWEGMRSVLTEDFALDSTGTGGGLLDGREEMIGLLEGALLGTRSAHHGHMPEIELRGPDEAVGIWALADLIVFPDGTRMEGYGHYHDTYRRVDGEWRIAASTVTRLLLEYVPPAS